MQTNGHRRNWWNAQGFCRADTPLSGGNLVSISDQAEQDWIEDLIQITYKEWTWRPIWIGLHGVWSDENQQWTDGGAVSYTNWMASKDPLPAYWPPVCSLRSELHPCNGENDCGFLTSIAAFARICPQTSPTT